MRHWMMWRGAKMIYALQLSAYAKTATPTNSDGNGSVTLQDNNDIVAEILTVLTFIVRLFPCEKAKTGKALY